MAVFDTQQGCGGLDVGGAVADAQGPVVTDSGLAPDVHPEPGIPAEVHPEVVLPICRSGPATTSPSEVTNT